MAVLAGAVSGLIGLGRLLIGAKPWVSFSVAGASLALVGGMFLGVGIGSSAQFAGWAPGPTLSPMHFPSSSPPPPRREANATVTLALTGGAAFVPTQPEPMGDGRFGQWCYSEPGNLVVSEVETGEVGRLDKYLVRVDLHLTDPFQLFAQSNLPVPQIQVIATDDSGVVFGFWTGPAAVAAGDATTGTVRFRDLQRDPGYGGPDLPSMLSGELSWTCGGWQD